MAFSDGVVGTELHSSGFSKHKKVGFKAVRIQGVKLQTCSLAVGGFITKREWRGV